MTPPDNIPAATKDHDGKQGSDDNRKTTSTRPPEQGLKCPRCNSPNTKFCYYNNYSLTQPRHFCKSCRRYWTKGGSLRNVPLGGGCRKNKKGKSLPSSSSSRLSFDSRDSSGNSSSELLGGFKLFEGLSPSLDLQGLLPFPPKLHHHQYPPTTGIYTQFSSFGDTSASATTASCFQLDPSRASNSLIGPNYNPLFPSSTGTGFNGAIQGTNSMNIHGNLAFSIESLSSINQDLHWKLQQQRLAMKLSGDNQKDSSSVSLSPVNLENQTQQQPHPILFQNLEISKPEIFPATGNSRKEGPSGDKPTEWFFGNSYSSVTPTPTTSSGGDGHDNASNNWGGVNAWGDVQQPYKALP